MERNDLDEEFIVQRANEKAARLRESMGSGTVEEVGQNAYELLEELCETQLSIKTYYNLCILSFDALVALALDELKHLEEHIKTTVRKMVALYKFVQKSARVVPRLYLMVIVGSVVIESQEAASKEILKDVVEMAKGVQQPLKGMFFRYFMLKMLKDRFPDKGSPYEGYIDASDDIVGRADTSRIA